MRTPWRRITVEAGGERYVAIVTEMRRNWSAHVPRLPGLVVAGPYVSGALDHDRARRKLAEGIEFHLEGLALEAADRQDRAEDLAPVGATPACSRARRERVRHAG
ncbi:MAG TPA: hypothetical protein VK821_11730 [Dehalococcoidia bacterium]|nr:hypothetical protein [Dehalococcoidia bacterium]